MAEHGAEPPVDRAVRHEQLARPEVAAGALDEEAVPTERRLDDPLHDPGIFGRHPSVVRSEDDRMARVVDDRGDGACPRRRAEQPSACGRRRVRSGRPQPAVRHRHPAVDRERRPPGPTPTRTRRTRRGGRGGPPDPGEYRFDVGSDELAVAADPGAAELDVTGTEWLCVCRRQRARRGVRRLRHERPGPRRLSIVEDAEVDVRIRGRVPRRGPRRRARSPRARGRCPPISRAAGCPSLRPGSPRRRDVGPPDAGEHEAHCGGGPQLGRATNSVGRTTSEGTCRRAGDRAGALPPSGPSRSCRAGRPRRRAGRGR